MPVASSRCSNDLSSEALPMGIPSPLCYSHEVQHVKGEVDVLAEFLLGCSGRLLKQLVRRLCEQKSVIDNCCEGSQSSLWRHVRHRPFMWRHVFIYGSAFAKQIFWSPERGSYRWYDHEQLWIYNTYDRKYAISSNETDGILSCPKWMTYFGSCYDFPSSDVSTNSISLINQAIPFC